MKEKYFLNRIRGIREIRVGLLFLSRVSGGSFTLPSLGTVLDSLPSHGSSYLTLLFY